MKEIFLHIHLSAVINKINFRLAKQERIPYYSGIFQP